MPNGLRRLALLHSLALGATLLLLLTAAKASWFTLVALLALAPLGPLLFFDRPLMWHLAKGAAYGFSFLCGVWLMYGVFGISGLGQVPTLVLYLVLAIYFVGVGGYLKGDAVRQHFHLGASTASAD